MKRTGEVTLTTIGLVFSFLGTLIVTTTLFFSNSDMFREIFEESFMENSIEGGIATSPGDAQMFLNFLLGMGWVVFTVFLISSILGALSIYFFIGNKKPIAASVIAIIAALIIIIGTAFAGFIPAILYLIAGIMGLVRKPPIIINPHVAETNLHRDQNKPDDFN